MDKLTFSQKDILRLLASNFHIGTKNL